MDLQTLIICFLAWIGVVFSLHAVFSLFAKQESIIPSIAIATALTAFFYYRNPQEFRIDFAKLQENPIKVEKVTRVKVFNHDLIDLINLDE